MLATFARVLTGFVLACLTAGLAQILFIMTPAQFVQLTAQGFQERASQAGVLTLLAATHAAIFSAAFTLIAGGIGESFRIRTPVYYIATGAIIAALGFTAQYASEVAGQPTIFNAYAMTAFAVSGLLAGFVYWLAAGRYAGGPEIESIGSKPSGSDTAPPVKTWKNRPRIVVEDPIVPGTAAAKRASLAERLAERQPSGDATGRSATTRRPSTDRPPEKAASTSLTKPTSDLDGNARDYKNTL